MERFFNKIRKTESCWLWTAGLFTNGYGSFKTEGKAVNAHRFSYVYHNGDISENLVVRHTCDNRKCVNPEHLILGEHKDNVADRVLRNRSASGENNGRSKLTEKDVVSIFKNNIKSKTQLAHLYSVDEKTIRKIKNKTSWKKVTESL